MQKSSTLKHGGTQLLKSILEDHKFKRGRLTCQISTSKCQLTSADMLVCICLANMLADLTCPCSNFILLLSVQ